MANTFAVCEKCGGLNRVDVDSGREPVCGRCKAGLPVHGAVVNARDATLPVLIAKSPLPVIVDVWAPWCGPCRAFGPTFEAAAREHAGQFVFVKLNSDDNPGASAHFGIKGIPTTLVFKGGREAGRQAGALPREQFGPWLKQWL